MGFIYNPIFFTDFYAKGGDDFSVGWNKIYELFKSKLN